MLKYGSNNIGKVYLGSDSIGKAYYGSNLVFQKGSSPTPPPQQTISYTAAEVLAGGNCGGFIANSGTYDGKWNSVSGNTYYGTIIDTRDYKGCTIRFEQADSNVEFMRFAALTSATFTNHATPSFSSETGFTGQIQHDWGNDTEFSIVLPSDADFLYVYTYSSGNNMSPNITIYADSPTMQLKNLQASLFTTNTTIGDNGTVYTGSSAEVVVCSGYLDVLEYAMPKHFKIRANSYPTGVTGYWVNIAEYNGAQKFIRRVEYDYAPRDIVLTPSTAYIRLMVVCRNGNEDLSGDVIRFDNDDIQSEGRNNQ